MPNASIGGLASGLDTATIISQLMQLEAAPQTRLKTKVSAEESVVKVLQSLNAKLAALGTQAGKLTDTASWTPLTASSSHTGVTLATTSGTASGSISLTVVDTAAAEQLTFASTAALTDVVVPVDVNGKHTVTLTVAGTPKTVDAGDGTLSSLVAALNAGGTGVSAAAMKLDTGSHRLLVQSTATGAANTVSLTAADGSALLGGSNVTTAARDAAITIGADTIHSATNTFVNLLPGLDLTVSTAAKGASVDVTVQRDTAKASQAAKALVDAVNGALSDIDAQSGYNAATRTSGPLSGEAGVRALRTALLNTYSPGDGTSLADIGIQTDRYGKLVLDEKKFATAYAADPALVTGKLSGSTGFAARVQKVAETASSSVNGTLTTAITGRNDGIKRLKDSIEQWDTRLELRRTALTRQFTALETAMGQMTSQSNWLAGQIGSLPKMSS